MFNIANLLAPKHQSFITEIDCAQNANKKFAMTHHQKTFVFENIQNCSDPTEMLRECFKHSIASAVDSAKKNGYNPSHIGATITSVLLTPEIYHPVRPIDDDIAETLLNFFLKVSQSKNEGSLLGEPFTLTVTTVDKEKLPTQRKTKGRGPGRNMRSRIPEKSLIKVDNKDNQYCLFYALEITRIYVTKELYQQDFSRFQKNYTRQKTKVNTLMSRANIPTDLLEYDVETWGDVVQEFYNKEYGSGKFKIFVFNGLSTKPIYESNVERFTHAISIYHNNNHFDGIRCITSFMNKRYYCFTCLSSFSNDYAHKATCTSRCIKCGGSGANFPCRKVRNEDVKCTACNKTFDSTKCFQHHTKTNFCKNSKQCTKCGVIYRTDCGHKCGEKYCHICTEYHKPEDLCYIRPYKLKKINPYRLVAFDFEATQSADVRIVQRPHTINFICAKITCTNCIKDESWNKPLQKECELCGPHRTLTWAPIKHSNQLVDQHYITIDPLSSFVDWISDFDPKFKTLAYSHFGGRYDVPFVFGEFVRQGVVPEIIRQGNRIYQMKVEKSEETPEIIFRDSFNFVSQKLDSLVKAFNLPIQSKQYFPHLYNNPRYYNTTLPHLPAKRLYLHESMKPDDKKNFEQWHDEHFNTEFNLNEKLAEYCENDVNILLHALIALRKTFYKISRREGKHNGIDILSESMTIASACMKHFRLNHLKEKHLGIVPERGYDTQQNQSLIALKFLAYYTHKNNISLQTVLSDEGEMKVGRYALDGYNAAHNRGVEVHGCYYHACRNCFPDDDILINGKAARFVREENRRREEYLKQHVNLEIYYECEIEKMVAENEDMRDFFKNYIDDGPINLRDSYFGGRTGPMKIYETVKDKPGYKISYKDFTSLYPFTNYKTEYPVGHPNLKIFNYAEQPINWTKSSDNPYKGILKVLIVPPRNLSVPVLPVRFDERLLFTLCKACSLDYPEGARKEKYECPHTDAQRQYVSTCTHLELNAALDAGYKAIKIFRVMKYSKWDEDLFKEYVREFYKIKLEASGFPDEIETDDEKRYFIEETIRRFKIQIDGNNVSKNPAMRTLAKLCLNSLWGRFSLRNTLSKTVVTDDPSKINELLSDPKIEIKSLDEISPEIVMVTYKEKVEFVEEHSCSNVVISLWTTSAARLHLLGALQTVAATPGCKIIYMDTDSIIYLHPIENDPLIIGPHLGDFTDEYPGRTITEVVSAGCKNYAIESIDASGKVYHSLKVRGFSLNDDVCKLIHYETFKQKTLSLSNDLDPIVVSYPHFLRPDVRKGTVYSTRLIKKWRPFVSKGIVVGHDVVNFGN